MIAFASILISVGNGYPVLEDFIFISQYKYLKKHASFQLITMMHFKFRVLPTLAVLTLASAVASALPEGGEPIPPSGLFCCPPYGPDHLPLNRQQDGPFNIFCYYSNGTNLECFYDPGTGVGGTQTAGCPTQAPANPHPPTCPICPK